MNRADEDTNLTDRDPETGLFIKGKIGGPGRPKGAKNKLQEAFWKDFASAWETHGAAALEKVALEDPAVFVRVAASVMPKDFSLDVGRSYVIRAPLPCATVEEWEARVEEWAGTQRASTDPEPRPGF